MVTRAKPRKKSKIIHTTAKLTEAETAKSVLKRVKQAYPGKIPAVKIGSRYYVGNKILSFPEFEDYCNKLFKRGKTVALAHSPFLSKK